MIRTLPRRRALLLTFLGVVGLALAFALFTNHVWEDYYITFRSSRNLATGHGLVYNVGERLHTFTSPLGVLLPALCSLLTANASDPAALWLFRLGSAAALGGAVLLLLSSARRFGYALPALVLLALLVVTDAKSLDFTINGMETAFMLLFLAYALWAHAVSGPRQWLHLGAAWAGLMWTRPDSFIYIALVAAGAWLFHSPARPGTGRWSLLRTYLRAAAVTTALYGPWLLWATWYYGTPVPHTIIAKGAQSGGLGAGVRLLHGFWQLPALIWRDGSAAEGVFLPSYSSFPTWPGWMMTYGRILATVSSLLWLVPRVRPEVRVASFAFYGSAAYLTFVPYYPFPWYYPTPFVLAALALAGVFAQLWASHRWWVRTVAGGGAAVLLAGALTLTVGVARQVRAQQVEVEDQNRKVIGEWLHEHARPGDSVFMEPLGYIGYYSGLKTYDWPGMSSREVVEARRLVGPIWESLILYLQPTWLVMRVSGEGDLPAISRALAEISFERVRDFDRTDAISRLNVPGRKFLEFDSHYAVYHRRYPTRHDADGYRIASPIGSSIRNIGATEVRMVHAPGNLLAPLPPQVREVHLRFGFPPEAIAGGNPTDGADFMVWLVDGWTRTRLLTRSLDPRNRPEDRALMEATLPLPARVHPAGAFLVLETKPHAQLSQDWTCWSAPEFH